MILGYELPIEPILKLAQSLGLYIRLNNWTLRVRLQQGSAIQGLGLASN